MICDCIKSYLPLLILHYRFKFLLFSVHEYNLFILTFEYLFSFCLSFSRAYSQEKRVSIIFEFTYSLNHSRLLILIVNCCLEFIQTDWIYWLNLVVLIFTDESHFIAKFYRHFSYFLPTYSRIKCNWLYLPFGRLVFKKKNRA
jgi:hypothetical protein